MGLFPEINRAWITIDNRLFLWNYSDGSDFYVFDGLDQVIVSAGLVVPKPGIFVDDIQYLLILATPGEVVLLGVVFAGGSVFGDLSLFPTQLSVPADGVNMLQWVGSPDGRIFGAGQDGALYEIVYAATEGWFSRRTYKINHTTSTLSALLPSFLRWNAEESLTDLALDGSRSLLFSLSDRNTITAYSLKPAPGNPTSTGNDLHFVGSYTSLSRDMTKLAPKYAGYPKGCSIVSLAALSRAESALLDLVAVTSTGVRLYFSTDRDGIKGSPHHLSLVHIRLPPPTPSNSVAGLGVAAAAVPGAGGAGGATGAGSPGGPGGAPNWSFLSPQVQANRISAIHTALYSRGTLVLADELNDDVDLLVGTCGDLSSRPTPMFAQQPGLVEAVTGLNVDGKTWAVAEIPYEVTMEASRRVSAASGGGGALAKTLARDYVTRNELATQHSLPARQFLCLTNTGLHLFVKLRPLDQLHALLVDSGGADSELLADFFKRYGPNQGCSMCLALATASPNTLPRWGPSPTSNPGSNSSMLGGPSSASSLSSYHLLSPNPAPGSDVISWATRAFFRYGGEPHFELPRGAGNNTGNAAMGRAVASPDIIFSGVAGGAYLYFARLVAPMWGESVTVSSSSGAGGAGTVVSSVGSVPGQALRFTKAELLELVEPLLGLRTFFLNNPQFISPPPINRANWAATQAQVSQLQALSAQAQTGNLAPAQAQALLQLQAQLQSQQYADEDARKLEHQALGNLLALLERSLEACSLLAALSEYNFTALVGNLPPAAGERLGKLAFRDLVTSGEGLEVARLLVNELMNDFALNNTSVDALSDALRARCPGFFSAADLIRYKGIELMEKARLAGSGRERDDYLRKSLKVVSEVADQIRLSDVAGRYRALGFYHGLVELALLRATALDPTNAAAGYVRTPAGAAPEPAAAAGYEARRESYEAILGVLDELWGDKVGGGAPGGADRERLQSLTLQKVLGAQDQALHWHVYQWFIDRGLSDRLLELNTPFLEGYLQTESVELLWKYYVRTKRHGAAAAVLSKLAEKRGSSLDLAGRLEYLSLAINNAKSVSRKGSDGDLLHELQEKMDVAQIQAKIVRELRGQVSSDPGIQAALQELDGELFNISALYNNYAQRFGLWESMLAILHTSGHNDPMLARSIWGRILEAEAGGGYGLEAVKSKVQSIGQAYHPSNVIFPVVYLVGQLERYSISQAGQRGWSAGWVVDAMTEVGVAHVVLYDVYNGFLESKDAYWQNPGHRMHLLEVLAVLLKAWLAHMGSARASALERSQFRVKAVDSMIDQYLVILSGHPDPNAAGPLRSTFQSLLGQVRSQH